MSFFKKYSGTSNLRLIRLERLVWTLIYAGLLALVLGGFMLARGDTAGHWWIGGGALVAAVGVLLIYVRSRLREGS